LVGAVGACVSIGHASVVAVSVALAERLALASAASTPTE
jgi:hypothetical protein